VHAYISIYIYKEVEEVVEEEEEEEAKNNLQISECNQRNNRRTSHRIFRESSKNRSAKLLDHKRPHVHKQYTYICVERACACV
jgi:hypothetical protein